MTYIHVSDIETLVRDLSIKAAVELPGDVGMALLAASRAEDNPLAYEILGAILRNATMAREERIPLCQDTGLTYVFIDIGQDVHVVGGNMKEAVRRGVARGYTEGFLRKSVVRDPLFRRENTGDNTPPVIHIDIVPGSDLSVTVMPKGTGSENMSAVRMLAPSLGPRGVEDFVMDTVAKGAPNACPPLVVGVGVGGMMDTAAYLAKKSLLRPVGNSNPDPETADMEKRLLKAINNLGIGPGGLGGSTTALAVHIETYPTHIGALPVAVNIQCHAARRASGVLKGADRRILRGALEARASDINEAMKIAAAEAIADLVSPQELKDDYIIVDPFDKRVGPAVAKAVAKAAIDSGVARAKADPEDVYRRTQELGKRNQATGGGTIANACGLIDIIREGRGLATSWLQCRKMPGRRLRCGKAYRTRLALLQDRIAALALLQDAVAAFTPLTEPGFDLGPQLSCPPE